jgi:integrase
MPQEASKVVPFRPKSGKNDDNLPPNRTKVRFSENKLPRYVIESGNEWFVRVGFRKGTKNGKPYYVQVKRKCPEKTAEAAELLANSIKAMYAEAQAAPADGETLGAFLLHFNEAKRSVLSRRVYESNAGYLERMLPSHLSETPIDKIVPLDIQKLYNSLRRTRTPSTIRKFHRILSSVFEQAASWDLIAKNPCKGAILPKMAATNIVSLDQDQAKRFLAECRKDPAHFIFEFLLETGLRPSEALALTWDDVGEHSVHVNKTLVEGFKGGGVEIKEPKTESSVRTVDISPYLSQRLVEHRTLQIDRIGVLINNKKKGVRAKKELRDRQTLNLVFPAERGNYQSVKHLNTRAFMGIAEKVGITGTLYCLRHSMATLSLAAGADLKTISQKLGHADPSVTLKVYLHVLKSMKSDATDKLASILYDSPATSGSTLGGR